MKKTVLLLIALIMVISSGACSLDTVLQGSLSNESAEAKKDTFDDTESAEPKFTAIQNEYYENLAESYGDFIIQTEDGKFKKDGDVYSLVSAGVYTVSGSLKEGRLVISAGDDDEVTLELNGILLNCSTDSPIYAQSADKVIIKAVSGTENYIFDRRAGAYGDDAETGGAAIYALCDLELGGEGSLTVNAGYNNGIQTNDDLKVNSLRLSVSAPDNALKGNDSVTIASGILTLISSAGDGIKTENSDISAKGNQRGTINICGGNISIYSACDGIDAAYDVEISGGETSVEIHTHSYSEYTGASVQTTASSSGVTKSSESAKGIKSDNEIKISGGNITVECMDDGIHANADVKLENNSSPLGSISISGGSVTIKAADDGVHADGTVNISGGYVDVTDSHEGIEGHIITVDGGEVHVYATDDGLNATSSGRGDGQVIVNGGKVFVEVGGRDVDGIDSNGFYTQTGGFVAVSDPGAESSGNMSAFDIDGGISVTGGVIIALGTVPGKNGFGGAGGGLGGTGGRPGGFGHGRSGSAGGSTNEDAKENSAGGFDGGFAPGDMNVSGNLPDGYVIYSGTLSAGVHTFTLGDMSESFTLRSSVTDGWIWAEGITADNYTLY